jgi:hypothetical protein
MHDLQNIVDRIRARKFPYKEVAAISALSLPTIWNVMRGKTTDVRVSTLRALEKAVVLLERKRKP